MYAPCTATPSPRTRRGGGPSVSAQGAPPSGSSLTIQALPLVPIQGPVPCSWSAGVSVLGGAALAVLCPTWLPPLLPRPSL